MKQAYKILLIGDSFVEGVGGKNSDGWAQHIKEKLNDYDVVVSGEGGDNTEKIIERWPKNPFDLVVVQVGTNDSRFRPSKGGHEIKPSQFTKNISKIIKLAKTKNRASSVILVGLLFVDEGLTVPYKEDKVYQNDGITKYDRLILEAAQKFGADYVSLNAIPTKSEFLSDGLHPSPEAHIKISNYTLPVILKHASKSS